jgi:hypothetical protein
MTVWNLRYNLNFAYLLMRLKNHCVLYIYKRIWKSVLSTTI